MSRFLVWKTDSAILYQLRTEAILISSRAICGSSRAFAVVVIMWRCAEAIPGVTLIKCVFIFTHSLMMFLQRRRILRVRYYKHPKLCLELCYMTRLRTRNESWAHKTHRTEFGTYESGKTDNFTTRSDSRSPGCAILLTWSPRRQLPRVSRTPVGDQDIQTAERWDWRRNMIAGVGRKGRCLISAKHKLALIFNGNGY
jgi:hypothetical protein